MAGSDIMSQITEVTANSINIALVIILLAVGYILKAKIKAVKNSDIPVYLIVIGVIISFLMEIPFTGGIDPINVVVRGIASAIAASIVYDKYKDVKIGRLDALDKTGVEVPNNRHDDEDNAK